MRQAPATLAAVQYGALCWRLHQGRVQVLLITGRDSGRWLIPRGWPMAGQPPHTAAQIEAWEEAGVTGEAASEPLGSYAYAKGRAPETLRPCLVAVFPLQVTGVSRHFPEIGQRRRKWFSQQKAARKVADPALAALIAAFSPFGMAPLDSGRSGGHILSRD